MARNHTAGQKSLRRATSHCCYCERKLYNQGKFKRTIEHFYPLHGGQELNKGWNKIIACHRCNNMKSGMQPEQFINYLHKQKIVPGHEYATDKEDIIKNVKRLISEKQPYYLIRDLL